MIKTAEEIRKQFELETGKDWVTIPVSHGELGFASWEYQLWLENKVAQFTQPQKVEVGEAVDDGKSTDWHLGNINKIKEIAALQSALNDFKEECERLANVAKFWQEEYYKINPNFIPPKIDNL